ncbi:MAG: DUF2341 domain-containing protein, partial [Promethearchaeota archaeon]
MVINKFHRSSKKRIKLLGFLLINLMVSLIFNSHIFNLFEYQNSVREEDVNNDRNKTNSILSSNHPISADDFKFYKIITIDNTKVSGFEDLIDFPLLISIYDSDLHDHTQSSGHDIAFSNDFQWLDHELELYNQTYNSTHAHLIAWVRIPVLSPSEDTIIRMYYGNSLMEARENPSKVWNIGYAAVWHLKELGTGVYGEFKDSSSNDNDGRGGGGFPSYVPSRISGKIGYAQEFDGIDDYINCENSPSVQITGTSVTIEAWVQLQEDLAPQWGTGIAGKGDSYALFQDWDGNRKLTFSVRTSGQIWVSDSNKQLTTWYHVVGVYNGTNATIFVDGNAVFSKPVSGSIASTSDSVWIGKGDQAFDGYIDEIRISNVVRSVDWIKTEFINQYNPHSFYSIGNAKNVYIPNIFDFKYFKEIIIDHTKVSGSSNLINFPVLVSIFDQDLHDKVQPDGDDIAFKNATSWLFHEIELFNQNYNITHAHLIVWIKIPKLSPFEDTIIRMYYGNGTMETQENHLGVWESNYVGVWHLTEIGNGTPNEYFDSSIYSNHGQGGNGDLSYIPSRIEGTIGYGQNFTNHFIDCGNETSLDITGNQISLQLWMKFPSIHPWMGPFNHKGFYNGYRLVLSPDSPILRFQLHGDDYDLLVAQGLLADEWHHVVATYDGALMKVFVDGEQDTNTLVKSDNILSALPYPFRIGHGDYPEGVDWTYPWLGQIDEVRVSKVARSVDWIKTEYNNQMDINNFYSLSNETKVEDEIPPNESYFNHYKIIKIDHKRIFGEGGHSNFPLLISFFDSDLHYDVQEDGDDIAFSLGAVWLDHEIELFNQNYNGTHALLIAWVRIPELSASLDTYIRMYYGNSTMNSRQNPTGVWEGSYRGVWHLAETSGVTVDSTSYNENGIISGTILRPTTGQIGNAYNYGTDGSFSVGNPADGHLDFGIDSFMVSMWINIDTSTGALQIPLYKGGSSTFDIGYCFGTPTTGDSLSFHITDGISNVGSPSAGITFDSWTYIIGVVDRTNDLIRIYKDGYEVGSGTGISAILNIDGTREFQCANPSYDFDGLLDEIRVLNVTRSNNWIKTEYYNQYDPNSFYSIGTEQNPGGTIYSNIQVNVIDLYGNSLPYTNVSIFNHTNLIQSVSANNNGTASFLNLIQAEYNFTASITSDIGNYIEIVNITSEAILINQSFQIINLICNVSSNFFEIVDIDDVLLDSGWIIVGNNSHELQNCSIDSRGQARFWWKNTLPYQYNYSVYYQDNNYIPNIIKVASGDLTIPNSSIQVQASLTTVNFNIQTLITKQPVDGVKLLLTSTNTEESIVNLTTDNNGIATLRWLNSSGINSNYSLQLEFFGALRNFNMTGITKTLITETNFTVSAAEDFYIYIEVSLENYKTELISLNPSEYISVQWGSQLKLRIMFNVSKAIGAEYLLGPTYSDIMRYEIFKGADFVQSGTFGFDNDYIGTHYSIINTESLESDITYIVFISAQKPGYSIPQDLLLQLNILKNDLILNQSQNDDSVQSVYWSDSIDFSVKAYGEISESFTTETSIFQDIDHNFRFSLPSINSNWNLTQIIFNIYNISWNANISDINISILDPYGVNRIFNISNHAGYDYNLGVWTGLTLVINKESPTQDNNFEFIISGTFNNTVNVIADASFIRNDINVQYMKYNISDTISFLSESEGWTIKNITFIIQNCYNTATWQKVNLSTLTNLNISTADGFKYSLHSGDENGNGLLIIDDRTIYSSENQYIFTVDSNPNVIFDAIIKVEYFQAFYQNTHLETINVSYNQQSIPNGGICQLSLENYDWEEDYAKLLVNDIKSGSEYLYPSQVGMNITIGGQTYTISNTLPGQGTKSLNNLIKDSKITAVIETNQPVNFSLSFKISYSRNVAYETLGTVNYVIRESPQIIGVVNYYPGLGEYFQTIDTSLIDADHYTMRFRVVKENYNSVTKDFDFIVYERLTLINGESSIAKIIEFIYVKDEYNFTFLYTDALTGVRIIDLKTQYYMWERYDLYGNVTANGEGTLIQEDDGSHVLDFDSENRTAGEYLIIVTLEKDNYEYKNAMIRFTIQIRELEYSLGNNFKNFKTNVVQGKIVQIEINLKDPTRGGIPLLNASVILIMNEIEYHFNESVNGTYILNFPTSNVNAFFASKTLTGIVNITREDYFSEEFFITIVVGMEEIFPGMPTFYFLIIIFGAIAVIGSIVGYRVYKHATIPTFVKNVRQMQKEIKGKKIISESLLYQTKEIFVGEIVRDKWGNIGLSMGDILGIEIKKSKKPLKTKLKHKTEKTQDQKPLGILVMKWDERIGTEILIKYPKDISISDKALMQVYSTHEYSGEKGTITLTFGSMNILSYYTGPELGYYIILFLTLDDDPDMYEGAMPNVAQLILQNLDDDFYLQMIPSLFQRLSVYPSLTKEQNLIFCYHDDINRMIINILRNYGVITKSELNIWVKDRDLEGIINLEAILANLIRWEIIKVSSVKGIPSELIFLTKDFFMLRVPPDT